MGSSALVAAADEVQKKKRKEKHTHP